MECGPCQDRHLHLTVHMRARAEHKLGWLQYSVASAKTGSTAMLGQVKALQGCEDLGLGVDLEGVCGNSSASLSSH